MNTESEKGEPGSPGERGSPGVKGEKGEKGEKGNTVSVDQLMVAIKLASAFGVAGLIAVGLALAIFVTTAASERSEICDVIEEVARGNAEALIDTADTLITTSGNENLTPEQEIRYQEVIEIYREGIEKNLEGCR